MQRNLPALSSETFDLLVVGAGVYGLCTAWDAAQRGLKVALVERGDFCGATSSNSLKVVHGGLRYLQQADLPRMRLAIRERRTLLSIAPHLVSPLAFVMPTRRRLTRSRAALRIALALNDLVGLDRNRDLAPSHRLPPGRLLDKAELLGRIPGLDESGITGGALWYDAQMRNSERLALGYLHRAHEAGAQAANQIEAIDLLVENGRAAGIEARDRLTGETFPVRARQVVNTAGPWVERILGRGPPRVRLSKAMNLVVARALVRDCAVGVGEGTGRLLFLVPWCGFTLVGTTHLPYEGEPDAYRVTERDVESFLAEVNRAHPAAALGRDDVRFFHGGLLPSTGTNPDGDAALLRHHRILDHGRRDGVGGLLSVVSVKWTTSRAVAEQVVDAVFRGLGTRPPPCRTATTPVRGGERSDLDALTAEIGARTGLDSPHARHLAHNHGSAYEDLLPLLEEHPGPLSPGTPVLKAEVVFAVREEMAVALSDVVFRRTELGSAGMPDEAALDECARLVGAELGWDDERRARELAEVRARFVPAAS